MEEEDSILDLTTKFKRYSGTMRQHLADLLSLKRKGINDKENDSFKSIYNSILYTLTSIRLNQRELYSEIEKNRLKNQTEKEKLEEILNYYESLLYLKNHLKSLIEGCKNFNTPALSKVHELKKKLDEMSRIQDFRNLKDYHFSVLSLIEKEYVERKAMKKKLEELEIQKTELEKETEEKRVFLAQIPNEIKKISEIMKEFMSIFRLNQSLHPEQHMLSKQLSVPLYNIYCKFCSLVVSKKDINIDILITKRKEKQDQDKYRIEQLELVLIIEESQSVKNKISEFLNIFKNQNIDLSSIFPLKFYIRYIIDFNIIVIQLDNKNFFTTEEIISNLFGEDEGKLIFENPKNEQERNINNKYQYYRWIQTFAGLIKLLPKTLEPDSNLLIHQIRQRIFSRIVLKRVVEELRKDVPLLIENLNKSFSFIKYSTKISEKLSIKGFNEITFNDYIKLLNWQDLVRRILKIQEGKISNFDDDENEGNMLKIIEQIEKTKKNNSFFEKFEVEESIIKDVLRIAKSPSANSFYRLEIEIKKKAEINILFTVNHNYPFEKTKFFIITSSLEEKKIKIPDFLIDKVKPKNNYQRSTQKFLNPYQVNNLENIITNSIKNIPDEQKPFCLVIKIAELLNILADY